MQSLSIHKLGERAITVRLGNRIDANLNARAIALAAQIRDEFGEQVEEVTCAYGSVTLFFGDWGVDLERCVKRLHNISEHPLELPSIEHIRPTIVRVRYDGQDLETLAKWAKLSVAEVVRLHSQTTYRVFALGFMPGFPYLGTVNENIAMPRLSTPRIRVPAGSVAIAGGQTGIYPYAAPGGWNIVGHTDFKLFDPSKSPPATLAVGQSVRFVELDPN